MLSIINTLLDYVFPPRETELLLRTLSTEDIKRHLKPHSYHDIIYLSEYRQAAMHALIVENKYYANPTAHTLLAQLLFTYFEQHQQSAIMLLPIPLHPTRERERGYNQVTEVLTRSTLPVATALLSRSKYTTTQTTLDKTQREKNLKDVFTAHPKKISTYTNTHFVLVDDVVTTGATIEAARVVLLPHLHPTCTLTCVALAH